MLALPSETGVGGSESEVGMMSIRVEKRVVESEVIVAIDCDMCGESCTTPEDTSEYAEFTASWGYESHMKDGQTWDCVLCEACAERVKQFIESQGGKVVVTETFS